MKVDVIFDIGSSAIKVKVINGHKNLISVFDREYEGFFDGEFFEGTEMREHFEYIISQLKLMNYSIKNCYIGLDNEFLSLKCKRITKKFANPTKIDKYRLLELFKLVENDNQPNYKLISVSILQATVDNLVVADPNNKTCEKLMLELSYVYAKQDVVTMFATIFNSLGIDKVEFISNILARTTKLDKSKSQIAVIDVGHLTTSVAVIKGDGAIMLTSFSLGGGTITSEIMDKCTLSYDESEELKRKVRLSLSPDTFDMYLIPKKSKHQISAVLINQLITGEIENICQVVKSLIKDFDCKDIYFTGNGVTRFKGIFKSLTKYFGVQVNDLDNIEKKNKVNSIVKYIMDIR